MVQPALGTVAMRSLRDNIFLAGSYSRKNFFLMRPGATWASSMAASQIAAIEANIVRLEHNIVMMPQLFPQLNALQSLIQDHHTQLN
jgi:hypothetical protein